MNEELSFVTYNISGVEYNLEKRLDAFLEYIRSKSPDVVVIQEGTRLTYERLLREMGLLKYKRYLPEIMNKRNLGEMIFSKYPISNEKFIPFNHSNDLRGISLLKIDMWGQHVWICTSQFDAEPSMSRRQVLDFAHTIRSLPLSDNIIFGGDTRICEYQSDQREPEGWYDAWYEEGEDKNKFTYDSETNFLVNPPYKDRPDRIWFRPSSNSDKNMECIEYSLFGHDSEVAISSHYGVWAKFRIV